MLDFILQERESGEQIFPELDGILSRLYSSRKIIHNEYEYSWSKLCDPFKIKNMAKAVSRMVIAYEKSESIVIVGDYDSDGATSISVVYQGLTSLGFNNVFFVVPNRFIHGYGLTVMLLDEVYKYQPSLVITVDNGIQSFEAAQVLKNKSIDLIITDHHLPSEKLPDALILNPNQAECQFPEKNLAGCGVAWYFMVALRSVMRDKFAVKACFDYLTVYAAIGTVADCVKLTYLNRIIVQKGLELIRQNRLPRGVKALCDIARVDIEKITSIDIAFKIAPRINASGRLDDMSLGVRCLLSSNASELAVLSRKLDDLNKTRQEIQSEMYDSAIKMLENNIEDNIFFNKSWHVGVVGLIASKIKEQLKKPVIVFAWDDKNSCYKGSGRSVSSINLKHVLDDVAFYDPDIMINFGGHAMAVGLSINKDKFEIFKKKFLLSLIKFTPKSHIEPDIIHDGYLPTDNLSADWFYGLYMKQPFGQGYEEPIFLVDVEIISIENRKNNHQYWTMKTDNNKIITAWYFSPKQNIIFSTIKKSTVVIKYLSAGSCFLQILYCANLLQ